MNFSIRDLKGIGPRKEALFARLHLVTVSDLLQYMPRDYEDRSHIWLIGQAPCGTGKAILVCGTVASVQEMRPRRGLSILKVMVSDGTGGGRAGLVQPGLQETPVPCRHDPDGFRQDGMGLWPPPDEYARHGRRAGWR